MIRLGVDRPFFRFALSPDWSFPHPLSRHFQPSCQLSCSSPVVHQIEGKASAPASSREPPSPPPPEALVPPRRAPLDPKPAFLPAGSRGVSTLAAHGSSHHKETFHGVLPHVRQMLPRDSAAIAITESHMNPCFRNTSTKLPTNRVRVSDLAIIKSGSVTRLERFRRVVRIVRVVKMEPNKKRPALLMFVNPSQRVIGDHFRSPLHALVTVLPRLALMKIRVIHVKPALKPRSRRCGSRI